MINNKKNNINFNMSEWFIILILHQRPGTRLKEIAVKYNLLPQRAYYVIKRLKDKGIIETKQDPKNGREVLYYLRIELNLTPPT